MSTDLSPSESRKNNQSIFQSGDSEETPAVVLPEVAEKRKCTNVQFLLIFTICLLLVIPLSIVFSLGSDINRFFYGYDKNGNTCGAKNKPIQGINCSGQDMTQKPIALLKYYPINRCFLQGEHRILPYMCVERCDPPNELIFHRCYPVQKVDLDNESKVSKQFLEICHVLSKYITVIAIMTLMGLVLAFAIFICLRCHTLATFWVLVIFQIIVSVAATSFFWHRYFTIEGRPILYLLLALATMGYLAFILLFLLVLHDMITLILGLYKEALNAIFKMPLILIQPLMTFLAVTISSASLVLLMVLVSSNECLKRSQYDLFTFEYSMKISTFIYICYLFGLMLWIFAFAEGCQCMIVSGAIGQYYFTREKSSLEQPLQNSFQLLMHHHLGTVAYGSLISALFSLMGGIVEYFMTKTYIQTALHGSGLCESSFRMIKLLCFNFVNTVGIAGFNYIVTYGFSLLIMLLTFCVGMWMSWGTNSTYYFPLSILFGVITASTAAVLVIQVLYTAVDTVFLCFCEEQVNSNGEFKNAYMHPDLLKIVAKANKMKKTQPSSL